jgi:signal transduction histidine kinase
MESRINSLEGIVEIAALPAGSQEESARAGHGLGQTDVAGTEMKPRLRSTQRLDKAQHAAYAALAAVSSYLEADEDLPVFFGRLSETVAGLVGARRAAFWRLGARNALTLQPQAFGFSAESQLHSLRIQRSSNGQDMIQRIVFDDDLEVEGGTSPELDSLWRELGLLGIKNSIAVPWRAGDRRIGALVAYDSRRGFTSNDLWVLRLAAMATGLVWQYKEAEDDLGAAAVRLEDAVGARRRLMNNIASGGDEARRRFTSVLHDDALQLLTAAELQLERIRSEANGSPQSVQLDQLKSTLGKVEDSLRRLLTTLSPESLELDLDLNEAIRERLESVRIQSGIETQFDLVLPDQVPPAIQAIVVKNVAEALTNVEKHSHATRVFVSANETDDGIRVEIVDDGAGFVVAEAIHMPGHMGLVAMKERAQLAGGRFQIESEPGAGTKVEIWVPLSL